MPTRKQVVRLGEIPPEIMDKPAKYSTTLVGVDRGHKVKHCGTGTFVRFGSDRFILTCRHCAEPLFKCERFGLPIHLGRVPLYVRKYPPIYVGARINDAWGPDLAFIPIDPLDADRIEDNSNKVFYNLNNVEQEMLTGHRKLNRHLWALVGSPYAESKLEGPTVFEFRQNTYTGIIVATASRNGFDYIETRVSVAGIKIDSHFMEGVSGGGVWYANVGRNQDGTFFLTEKPKLEGVAFYRTAQRGQFVRIRCHGRKSIYKLGLNTLRTAGYKR